MIGEHQQGPTPDYAINLSYLERVYSGFSIEDLPTNWASAWVSMRISQARRGGDKTDTEILRARFLKQIAGEVLSRNEALKVHGSMGLNSWFGGRKNTSVVPVLRPQDHPSRIFNPKGIQGLMRWLMVFSRRKSVEVKLFKMGSFDGDCVWDPRPFGSSQ